MSTTRSIERMLVKRHSNGGKNEGLARVWKHFQLEKKCARQAEARANYFQNIGATSSGERHIESMFKFKNAMRRMLGMAPAEMPKQKTRKKRK